MGLAVLTQGKSRPNRDKLVTLTHVTSAHGGMSVDVRKCMATMELFRGQAALNPSQASTPRDSRSDVASSADSEAELGQGIFTA